MRNLRRFLPTEIYFVTIRTVEERFALDPYACPGSWIEAEKAPLDFDTKLLAMRERGRACVEQTEILTRAIARAENDANTQRPEVPYETFTNSIPNIIGSCMARGIALFGIHLYGFVWMSNHGHLLLAAPKGNFAEFMAYLNGQTAVNVNRFLGRTHQLWSRRYSAAQVLDEPAELQLLAYLLANPINAGIADTAENWPGLSSAAFFFQNSEQRFLSFDRTAWHKKGRPSNIAPFLSTAVLEHQLLPQLSNLEKKKLRRKLRQAIGNELKPSAIMDGNIDIATKVPIRRSLVARVVIPTDRPQSSKLNLRKRSPQPLCHTTKPYLRKLYREWHREFRIAYSQSSEAYRSRNTETEFPPGSFAPSKYPQARHPSNPNEHIRLNPTRSNLEMANALMSTAT